ncbi:hypothetical protein D9M73_231260 [compost metagenome]
MKSTSLTPVNTNTPAKLATGICCSTLLSATTKASNHKPWKIAEARVCAPAWTLAELRTITPVIGRAPSTPHSMLPMP